jgi:hypothetical protein
MLTLKTKQLFKKIFGNIFSAEQLNKNLLGNILGLQIARYLIAKLFYNLKYFFVTKKDPFMKSNGYLVIENFLTEEEFSNILKEYSKAINDKSLSFSYKEYGEGVDATHFEINNKIKSNYPNLYNLYLSDKINSFFKNNELKNQVNLICNIERIKSLHDNKKDKVKTFHYDTYFNTFKAWLYINDVDEKNGPLVLLEKSHKFSFKRMINEWRTSINYSLSKDKKNWFGYGLSSANEEKISDKVKKILVKKNTFIIVNTHSLHRRGDAEPGSTRDTIHFYTRENPFKIFN